MIIQEHLRLFEQNIMCGYTKIVILVAIIETLHFSIVNKEAMQNKKKSIPIRKRSIGMTYIGTVLIVTKYMCKN